MTKKVFHKLLYGVLALATFPQISCDSQGHGGISNNINESKNRNVFINEYEVKPNPYIINDTLQMAITSAWVENQWAYGKSENITIVNRDKFQLVIEVNQDNLKNYGFKWTIGINGDRYLRRCGKTCLVSDFNQLPKDVEEWEVQNGLELDSISEKTIIGRFKIQKKKTLNKF